MTSGSYNSQHPRLELPSTSGGFKKSEHFNLRVSIFSIHKVCDELHGLLFIIRFNEYRTYVHPPNYCSHHLLGRVTKPSSYNPRGFNRKTTSFMLCPALVLLRQAQDSYFTSGILSPSYPERRILLQRRNQWKDLLALLYCYFIDIT